MIQDEKNIKMILEKLSVLTELFSKKRKMQDILGLRTFKIKNNLYETYFYINIDNVYILGTKNNLYVPSEGAYPVVRDEYIKIHHPGLYTIYKVYSDIDNMNFNEITQKTLITLNSIYEDLKS